MTIEEARLDFRLDPGVKARIERAAKLSRQPISRFVIEAATAAADRVLARSDLTMMPADQFDELFAALDTADEAPALKTLAKRERRFAGK